MFEKKSGILLIGGLGFFLFAFLSNAVVPILMYRHMPEKTAEQLVSQNVMYQFEDLSLRFPEAVSRSILANQLSRTVPTRCESVAIFTSPRVAGIVTASSCGPSPTKANAGGPSRRQSSIRTNCSDR